MAANVLDVVAKALTVATNFLMFCSTGSVNGVAFMVGASGVNSAAGEGRVCTGSGEGSGLLVAWVVGFWGSSPASFPLPSSLDKGRISSSFFHGPYTTHNCGASCSSSGVSAGSSFNSS